MGGSGTGQKEMLDGDAVATELLAILKEDGSSEFSPLRGVAWASIPSSSSSQCLSWVVTPRKDIGTWAKRSFRGGTKL